MLYDNFKEHQELCVCKTTLPDGRMICESGLFIDKSEKECSKDICPYMVNPVLDEPKPSMASIVDIQAIIDDAMEKKDRMVSIFISPSGTTVNVQPLDDKKPRWMYSENAPMYDYQFKCSECGAFNNGPSPYCPVCGEKLAAPEEEKDDQN